MIREDVTLKLTFKSSSPFHIKCNSWCNKDHSSKRMNELIQINAWSHVLKMFVHDKVRLKQPRHQPCKLSSQGETLDDLQGPPLVWGRILFQVTMRPSPTHILPDVVDMKARSVPQTGKGH